MKAFTVTMDGWSNGIRVRRINAQDNGDNGFVVLCGEPALQLIGPKEVIDELFQMEEALELRSNGNVGFNPAIDRKLGSGNIASENWISPEHAGRMLANIRTKGWPIRDLEVSRDGSGFYAPRGSKDTGEAMLHLLPMAAEPESIKFWGSDSKSVVAEDSKNGGRKVVKLFEPGFGAGCTPLFQGFEPETKAPEAVVKVVRGTSFRISRNPDPMSQDDPAEVIIIWTGGTPIVQASKRNMAKF